MYCEWGFSMRFHVFHNSKILPWLKRRWVPLSLGIGGSLFLAVGASVACQKLGFSDSLRVVYDKIDSTEIAPQRVPQREHVPDQISHSVVLRKIWQYLKSDWMLLGTVIS